jgi:hypothetical protein
VLPGLRQLCVRHSPFLHSRLVRLRCITCHMAGVQHSDEVMLLLCRVPSLERVVSCQAKRWLETLLLLATAHLVWA